MLIYLGEKQYRWLSDTCTSVHMKISLLTGQKYPADHFLSLLLNIFLFFLILGNIDI